MSLASFFKRIGFGSVPETWKVVLPRDIPNVPLGATATSALRAVLAAYGIEMSAAQVDEECRVDENGASIDTIEQVAKKYGIPATQAMVPREHVLAWPHRLPVIAVYIDETGLLQFLLIWRIENGSAQILDVHAAVRWERCETIEAALHVHELDCKADGVATYLKSDSFAPYLGRRLAMLGIDAEESTLLLGRAMQDPSWRGMAALDAATRHMTGKRVSDVRAALRSAFNTALREVGRPNRIPSEAFSIREAPRGIQGEERVVIRGAVIVEVFPT